MNANSQTVFELPLLPANAGIYCAIDPDSLSKGRYQALMLAKGKATESQFFLLK